MEHGVRIAILSDIHGNIDALNAVIDATPFQQCDVFLNAGDSVGYYLEPAMVIEKLMRYGFISIKGNHEEMLQAAATNSSYLLEITLKYGVGHQICFDQLSEHQLRYLFDLPFTTTIQTSLGNIEVFHGSPTDSSEYIYPDSDLEIIAGKIPQNCKWLILGNTHWPMLRSVGGTTVINPGSVGQPRNGSGKAQWAVLDTLTQEIEFHEEVYDMTKLVEQLKIVNPNKPKLWEVLSPK
jgi:putative phosphoesterase